MTAITFLSWTDFVKLHPNVKSGMLAEVVLVIDLGSDAVRNPNVPD